LRSGLFDYTFIHCLNEKIFLIAVTRLWPLILAMILALLDISPFVLLLYKDLFSEMVRDRFIIFSLKYIENRMLAEGYKHMKTRENK